MGGSPECTRRGVDFFRNNLKEMAGSLRIRGSLNTQTGRMNKTDELIPTRKSLLSRLKNWDDQESWRVFFETYWKLIYTTGIKAGLTETEAQDVVQETVISILKSMGDFKYQSNNASFKSWLLQLTSWRITDQLR